MRQLLPGTARDPFSGQNVPAGPGPEPETSPEDLAAPPGWGPAPEPIPGRRSPDQPSPAAGEDGAGSASPTLPPPTPKWSKDKAAAYSAIARALLTALGGYANMLAAADEDDTAWLPDEEDQAAIPPPLGRLTARRIPLGDLAGNYTDLADIGEALVGLAAYIAKSVTATLNARRARRRSQGSAVHAPDLPPGDQ